MADLTRLYEHVWFCPQCLRCAIRETWQYRIRRSTQAAFYRKFSGDEDVVLLHLMEIAEQGQFDEVELVASESLQQCDAHRGRQVKDYRFEHDRYYLGWHYIYTGNAWRPDTCVCGLAYYFDERESSMTRVHVPVDHPRWTTRCPVHAHLTNPRDHYIRVLAENQFKNTTIEHLRSDLVLAGPYGKDRHQAPVRRRRPGTLEWDALKPTVFDFPYHFDDDRALVLFGSKLRVPPHRIEESLAKLHLPDGVVKVHG